MTLPIPQPDPDRIRASDVDREQVVAALNRATGEGRLTVTEVDERLRQVYAARTLGELRPITRDLPGQVVFQPSWPAPAVPASSDPAAVSGLPAVVPGAATGHATAIFSGFDRKGAWVVPERLHVTTVMGGGSLDLTQASFSAREVTIQVFALFGGLEIVVPPTVQVIVDTFALFGGVDNTVREAPPAGAPVVHVTGFVMFGGVSVSPPKRGWREQLRGRRPVRGDR